MDRRGRTSPAAPPPWWRSRRHGALCSSASSSSSGRPAPRRTRTSWPGSLRARRRRHPAACRDRARSGRESPRSRLRRHRGLVLADRPRRPWSPRSVAGRRAGVGDSCRAVASSLRGDENHDGSAFDAGIDRPWPRAWLAVAAVLAGIRTCARPGPSTRPSAAAAVRQTVAPALDGRPRHAARRCMPRDAPVLAQGAAPAMEDRRRPWTVCLTREAAPRRAASAGGDPAPRAARIQAMSATMRRASTCRTDPSRRSATR